MRLSREKTVAVVISTFVVLVVLGVVFYLAKSKDPVEVVTAPTENLKNLEPKYKVLGTSLEGRKIESYTFGMGEKHLVFIGGIHGGYEWNTVLLAYEVLDYLKANPDIIPPSLSVSIIPVLNPDGLFSVVGKEGRFTAQDVSKDSTIQASGRFNANDVDLNRNFGCKWKPKSTWREKVVSAGTAPFSEPESLALKNYVIENSPDAVVFWHSQANTVYASECEAGILPGTLDIMNTYAKASGYSAVKTFDSYETTGDSEGWLASIGIPAVTVEFKNHQDTEFQKNISGVKALFEYYSQLKR